MQSTKFSVVDSTSLISLPSGHEGQHSTFKCDTLFPVIVIPVQMHYATLTRVNEQFLPR